MPAITSRIGPVSMTPTRMAIVAIVEKAAVTAQSQQRAGRAQDDPAEVARQGVEALMAGKERQVAGSLKTQRPGTGRQGDAGRSRPRCTARWPSRTPGPS